LSNRRCNTKKGKEAGKPDVEIKRRTADKWGGGGRGGREGRD
jgi:hypothetical protein